MQNETQNQDTQAAPQQPVMEEAQAAPEQAMDETQAATSEVHDDPGISQQQEQQQGIAVGEPDPNDVPDRNVTMYPEDLSGPETAQEQPGFDDGISIEDISKPLAGDLYDSNIDYFVEPVDEPDWGVKTAENPSDSIEVDFGWGFDFDDFDLPVAPEGPSNPLPTEPTNTGVVPPWLQEPSGPLSDDGTGISKEDIEGPSSDSDGLPPREVTMYPEDLSSPETAEGDGDATPGGYDGSGIAGGLDLDHDGVFDRTENNPDMSGKDYTYDEGAYEDAEDAFEDLQDALKHGDEEERAEAIEKLQGYLGGFDKGAEKDQDGTETQDGKIPSDSKDDYGDGVRELFEDSDGDGVENYKDSDHYRDGNFDFEDSDGNGILDLYEDSDGDGTLDVHEDSDGDPEKVPNTADNKEPADAPDASGAAVSGPAVGAAGAAVGAGAVDQAIGAATQKAGSAIDEQLGVEGSGNILGNLANGNTDGAIDAATQKAGSAIDEQLGVEGSGKVLDSAANGDWEAVASGADKMLEGTGISGVGDTIKAISEEKWEELPGEFGETAGSAIGAYFGGDAGAAVGAKIGQEVGDLVEDGIDAIGDAWDSIWD